MAMTGANPFALEGETILIAGGASGIGASTAATCAALGAKLVLADIADARAFGGTNSAAKATSAVASRCDVTDRSRRRAAGHGAQAPSTP